MQGWISPWGAGSVLMERGRSVRHAGSGQGSFKVSVSTVAQGRARYNGMVSLGSGHEP